MTLGKTADLNLTDQQRQRAIEVLGEFLGAQVGPEGLTPIQVYERTDSERIKVLKEQLLPLLDGFLVGTTGLSEFKTKVDGINKRNQLWGFKGIKGQMFFNMLTNAANNEAELDQELKAALAVPINEQIAASRIKTFASYVNRIGDEFVAQGNKGFGRPKISSIPFFLSYFWQINNPREWPVYYTNSVQTMIDLNLWQPKSDLAEDYLTYKHIHEELAALFSKTANKQFGAPPLRLTPTKRGTILPQEVSDEE